MFFPFFDSTMIILIPAIIISLYAQAKVQGTFKRYLRINAASGLTGAEVARRLLTRNGVHDVAIEVIPGNLTDHYDPRKRILRLSQEVYRGSSLASVGVAAHETGHAIQHNTGYLPLEMRNNIVPVVNIGSNMAFPLLFLGLILGNSSLAMIGVYAFALVVVFQLLTLPVEFNASGRALALLDAEGIVTREELGGARKVLNAAALTYVAAALAAILNLVRLLILSGALGRRDD